MLLALTGGQKLGIALAAAAFIVFALGSSFLMPRREPNFPGRGMPLFVIVSILFFVGMMTAMFALAREEESEAHGTAAPGAVDTHEGTDTTATTGGAGTGETETGGATQGDAEAGGAVFDGAGCGSCHVLEEAGSSGTAGPSLDETQASFEEAVEQITNGGGGMPPFGDQLSDEEIQNVAAFVVESAGN